MNKYTFYRVTDAPTVMGQKSFTNHGDTIAVQSHPDTDIVFNLTTGGSYIYTGEQGTVIKDINNFPLFDSELANKKSGGYNMPRFKLFNYNDTTYTLDTVNKQMTVWDKEEHDEFGIVFESDLYKEVLAKGVEVQPS